MLRIHFMQQCFGLSDPAMEEALHDMALFREFAQLDAGATRLPQAQHPGVDWQVAMMPGKRRALNKSKTVDALIDKLERIKASIRAKVEHPFRVIKCQFGCRKTRYRCLVKKTAQLTTLFALSNLWMVRKRMIQGPAG